MVQIRMVSIKGSIMATMPSRTGSSVLAAAWTMAAEPTPASLENVDPLWSSPYTLSFSSLNSWVGEEVRFSGLDLAFRHGFTPERFLFFGATALIGNDAVGAALAWRGWSAGDRLTVLGETVPLPALASLADSGFFGAQRDDGTKPFGSDLDGRVGHAARMGFEVVDRFTVQVNHYDNRADRGLHDGEYAWETDFLSAGLMFSPHPDWRFSGEWLSGRTGMGPVFGAHAQLDIETWHALLSFRRGAWRATARYDVFSTVDVDRTVAPVNADLNDEEGEAATLALLWHPARDWRVGLEWLDFDVMREAALTAGLGVVTGGEQWTIEVRRYF